MLIGPESLIFLVGLVAFLGFVLLILHHLSIKNRLLVYGIIFFALVAIGGAILTIQKKEVRIEAR
jgi:hypothetical protein